MSFAGDLEHLPIVDVIQLMNSTRKSGILKVRGRKGESQLVFKDGFIVSASHLNGSVRIGQLLVDRGAVSQEDLDRALEAQSQAGDERCPLIVTMLDMGLVEQKDAYSALQALIEMTIVETLTWKKGSFILEANLSQAPDSYQFYPERSGQEINVDTQGVLMDSLRIFDEKLRDGELTLEDENEELELSADDLGLGDLDQLDRQVPGVFASINDSEPAPAAETQQGAQLKRLNELIARLPKLGTPPEVALAQLQYVAEIFGRALTLIVSKGDLLAERGIGISGPEVTAPLKFRLPLARAPLLRQAVQTGQLYLGDGEDEVVKGMLHGQIGAPGASNILLLPVACSGKTVFVTYADFGDRPVAEVPVALLEMLAEQTGQALQKVLPRKK